MDQIIAKLTAALSAIDGKKSYAGAIAKLTAALSAIDGKKSYAGAILLGVAMFLRTAFPAWAGVADLLTAAGSTLSVGGLAHKLQKLIDVLKAPEDSSVSNTL